MPGFVGSVLVQPGPPTSPSAFDQPPEYQAQLTLAAVSSSPMLLPCCSGSWGDPLNGWLAGWMVLTAKSPQARFATAEGQTWVSCLSSTAPVGVYCGYVLGMPLVSMIEWLAVGAPGHVGAAAAMRYWWFRNEPPNEPWKKSSAMA